MEEMDRILCDELLEEVLSRLPPRSTFSPSTADVSLVSKRWLRLYRSSRTTLSLLLSPDNCTPQSLCSFLSHFPSLSSLLITIFSDRLLSSVASSCTPELTHLCLRRMPVSLSPLLSLPISCPHLTSLSISFSPHLSFHWLLHFPSPQQLDVVFASLPTEFEYVDAASKGNNLDGELELETLTLEGIRRGDCVLDGLWESCKKLKKLQLRRCHGIGDNTSVSSFNNCLKGLQEVELWCCGSIVNDILMRLLENCTSLNSLSISALLIGDAGREGLLQFITHSRCNLRKLDLGLPRTLRDNHLLAVAEKFSGLLSLRLESCLLVSHEGLTTMALAMSSNKLEELALIDCNVEPGLLTTLGQSFRNLRKLDLSYNDKLADEEFISMLASLNCLRELNVRGCKGLTNASVASMFKSCEQLETVDLVSCDGIEAEAVELFVLNCVRLRQICVEESKLSDVSRSWASKKFIEVMHIAKATSASHPPLRWHVFYKSDTKYPLSTRADFPLRSGIGQCVLVIVPQEMPPCSFRETCTAVYYFSCSGHLFDWNFLCVSELFIWSSLKAIRLKAQSKTNAFFRLFIQLNVLYVVALKVIF
ncbi:hypothetical protein RHSIM_Rhsim08G0049600 [Rhododendron simsii]|uniref:F-box/LRR-repeat protein 15-like leucin rich repeat domain-containing protein n=1 Tax=Rhododendron simsii TaxID=118357 RepID=A0A834LGN5_RHOSS|nr:hypothetical protein RHSIM_Rhsim08G0049600 [Rhododendron simsii]